MVIKNIYIEQDESTIQTLLGRVSTALNYYIESEPPAVAGGLTPTFQYAKTNSNAANVKLKPSATADGSDLRDSVEKLLINKIETAPTIGQNITYFLALQIICSGDPTKKIFNDLLTCRSKMKNFELKTKDKLHEVGVTADEICPLCAATKESVQHLYFECPFSQRCLDSIETWIGIRFKAIARMDFRKYKLKKVQQ